MSFDGIPRHNVEIKYTKIVARVSLCFVGIAMNSKRGFIASFIFLIKCNAATRPLIFLGNVVSFSIINTTPVKNLREMNSNGIESYIISRETHNFACLN